MATSHLRFLAPVIQLALVSGMFAACGGDDDDTVATGGNGGKSSGGKSSGGSAGNSWLRDQKLLIDETTPRLPGVDPSAPRQLALGYGGDRLPAFVTPPHRRAGSP